MTSLLTLRPIHSSPINRCSRLVYEYYLQNRASSGSSRVSAAQRVSSRAYRKQAMAPMASAEEKTQQQTGGGDLVLLDFWVSPFAQRCRIALAEKNLPYKSSEQELLGTKSDLLLRSNPIHKKVPVLLHAGHAVSESLIILEYLDDAFPAEPPLLPADPYARAQARFWAAYSDKVYETGSRLWKLKNKKGGEEARAQVRKDMLQVLGNLDGELADGRPFFAGDEFGFVDLTVVPFVPWLPSYERYGEFKVDEVAPRLAAWAARCAERESVAKSLYPAQKVDEFITLLKKHYGIE